MKKIVVELNLVVFSTVLLWNFSFCQKNDAELHLSVDYEKINFLEPLNYSVELKNISSDTIDLGFLTFRAPKPSIQFRFKQTDEWIELPESGYSREKKYALGLKEAVFFNKEHTVIPPMASTVLNDHETYFPELIYEEIAGDNFRKNKYSFFIRAVYSIRNTPEVYSNEIKINILHKNKRDKKIYALVRGSGNHLGFIFYPSLKRDHWGGLYENEIHTINELLLNFPKSPIAKWGIIALILNRVKGLDPNFSFERSPEEKHQLTKEIVLIQNYLDKLVALKDVTIYQSPVQKEILRQSIEQAIFKKMELDISTPSNEFENEVKKYKVLLDLL